MRKSIKKIMSVVTAAAMTLAMVAVPSVKAMAANGSYALIGNQFDNWKSTEAAKNFVTTDNGDGTESFTFTTEAGKCYEFKAFPVAEAGDNWWKNAIGDNGNNCSFFAKESSSTTITIDVAQKTVKWNNTDKNINPNPAEEYYVVGDMNGWSTTEATKMTKNSDGTYSATMELAGKTYEFKVVQDAPTYGWYKEWGVDGKNAKNTEGLAWDKEKLTVTFNPADGTITSKAVEVVAKEDPTEEPTEEIDGDSLTVHVATDWLKPNLYAFTTGGDNTPLLGGWPGTAIKANKDNKGYYSIKFALDTIEEITVIVNGSDADANSVQTVNVPVTDITEGANEIWVTISDEKGEEDEFGNSNFLAEYTTDAPEGWVAGELEEVEPEDETEPEDGEDGEDEEDEEEGDDTAAWDSMKLKIHFLNSENWEKVGVYLTYGSWAEITGSWPGSEMGLEIGSETWYAVGTNGTKEETYNVIFNDMVSDADASEDNKKHQTPDTKDLTVGEYWFVLDEVTAESDTQVTYGVKMYTSVEDLEADGYTYDGQGLDSVKDPGDGKDNDEEDENAEPGTKTGDALPYAVVLLGAAAVVAVVASKKRNNA